MTPELKNLLVAWENYQKKAKADPVTWAGVSDALIDLQRQATPPPSPPPPRQTVAARMVAERMRQARRILTAEQAAEWAAGRAAEQEFDQCITQQEQLSAEQQCITYQEQRRITQQDAARAVGYPALNGAVLGCNCTNCHNRRSDPDTYYPYEYQPN